MISPPPQLTTPSPAPTTVSTTTSIPELPDFSSVFEFDQRVSTLETELTRIGYATRTALESYTKDFEKKAQEERKLYIDVVEKSIKDIIKDESTINESLENVILAKSSSYPKSTYEAAESLTEFELKKILLDKMESSESYKKAPEHKELYEVLVKSYNLDKDLFLSYGNVYSLKRDLDDKDKDEDPSAGSDRGLKKQKTTKDVEPLKGSKSKESKTSSSKGTKSQPKSSASLCKQRNQCLRLQTLKCHKIKEVTLRINTMSRLLQWMIGSRNQTIPSTPDCPCNDGKSIDSGSATLPKQVNLLERPAFNLLKGTCKSFVELEYHFKECYKAVIVQVDWNNPEVHEYPFELSKPLSLIEAQGRQVVHANYFFNNDLEYLKGGSSSRNYGVPVKVDPYEFEDSLKDGHGELKLKPLNRMHMNKSHETQDTHQQLYNTLYQSITLDQEALDAQDAESSFHKRTHDNQDPSNDREGEKMKKRRKDAGESSSRSSRKDKSLVVPAKEDTPADQPQDLEDVYLVVESYQRTLNLTKPKLYFDRIKEKIPYTMSGIDKGVVYLNQHNFKSLMKLSEVYKFCDGTLMKIRDNLINMVNKNELGRRNKRLKGRDWNDKDIKRSNEMLDKIDQMLKRIKRLTRFEEYVRGRPKTTDSCFYVRL
ncbi:hypothetical protein Tco_1363185 [Tanacetum coccineum]